MQTTIQLQPGEYTSPTNCPIAKGLKAKGFTRVRVSPVRFWALKWGFIPITGGVPEKVNGHAYELSIHDSTSILTHTLKYKIGRP